LSKLRKKERGEGLLYGGKACLERRGHARGERGRPFSQAKGKNPHLSKREKKKERGGSR